MDLCYYCKKYHLKSLVCDGYIEFVKTGGLFGIKPMSFKEWLEGSKKSKGLTLEDLNNVGKRDKK
jgi:hypothetical protein